YASVGLAEGAGEGSAGAQDLLGTFGELAGGAFQAVLDLGQVAAVLAMAVASRDWNMPRRSRQRLKSLTKTSASIIAEQRVSIGLHRGGVRRDGYRGDDLGS